ncbi:tail fiber domain-containing protein [Citrobacter freundii]|uniref:tail fiber domain-containing protein n=1 Tax=Citrobacter freundii TaxID=546 RepID=UPI00388E9C1E|nr:tail fiber domain-containing protein [Citrobacter freundii]HCC5968581.1 tail fiber domain-containing protein [Citrobacter freundii]HCC7721570.1 tail fiber domain-containing protein [Citrobacter freundii]HCC7927997.1 tail fiber domain-containing protein [Citrobacter freundii]
MSAGTLTLTNNSAQVSGAGTSFTTELTAGDFIVVTVGGVPYTLPVKSVESGTALTLISNFTGPTQSGAAWSAVPRVALNMVTAALVAQSAEALRGLNYDKQNWQQFFTATGDVTITLPDNSQTTGPSAKKLISSVGGKADKTDLDKKADSHFPSFTGIMNFDGGAASIYQSSYVMIMRTAGVDLLQLSSNGIYLVSVMDAAGGYRSRQGQNGATTTNVWNFHWNGSLNAWVDSSNVGQVSLVTTSDKFLKKDIIYQSDESPIFYNQCLDEVLRWKPALFKYKERGVIPESDEKLGFIANDLVEVSPECVTGEGLKEDFDPLNPVGAYSLNEVAMLAKLTGAIQALQKQITELQGSSV